MPKIIYTLTDEAPALATYSLLPIVQAFTQAGGCAVETRDISLAGRILAQFPERLAKTQEVRDDRGARRDRENAGSQHHQASKRRPSVPQLQAAVKELREQGYDVPEYPEEPRTEADKAIKAKYAKVLGSAVNPVLREGNSDRRVAASVKQYAKKHPHSMGVWSKDSKTHVASMGGGDFYSSEQSVVVQKSGKLKIELTSNRGDKTVLKEGIGVSDGDVIAASSMSRRALRDFFAKQVADAKAGCTPSLH